LRLFVVLGPGSLLPRLTGLCFSGFAHAAFPRSRGVISPVVIPLGFPSWVVPFSCSPRCPGSFIPSGPDLGLASLLYLWAGPFFSWAPCCRVCHALLVPGQYRMSRWIRVFLFASWVPLGLAFPVVSVDFLQVRGSRFTH